MNSNPTHPAATPIIDRPERQGGVRRTAYGAITAVAWFAYAYLWMPLLTLLAWVLGFRTAYSELFLRENAIDAFLVLVLPLIALGCALALLGWAEYNRVRFQREDRRQVPALASYEQVDASLGARPGIGDRLRNGRILAVRVDEHASPLTVNERAIPSIAAPPA